MWFFWVFSHFHSHCRANQLTSFYIVATFVFNELLAPIFNEWSSYFVISLLIWKLLDHDLSVVVSTSPRDRCAVLIYSSKMGLLSSPDWRIGSKSLITSSYFILFSFYFLKIFSCCFFVISNVVICWINIKKQWKNNYRLGTSNKKNPLAETIALLSAAT